MVASKPFRSAQGLAPGGPPGERPLGCEAAVDTVNLSIREIRALLASLRKPDPALFASLARDPRATARHLGYSALRKGRSLAANEDIFRDGGIRFLAGADEAGRGALAGPLVAAAVMFAPGEVVEGANDSKKLTPKRREELYDEIMGRAESVSVVFVDAGLIDRWGIQPVNLQALGGAIAGIDDRCQRAICDHFSPAGCPVPTFGVPRADETFQSVAAASIVAKVERDRLMRALHRRFPRYNFAENKGYGTVEHLRALAAHGPSPFHRLSFSGVLPDDEMSLWESAGAEE